MSGKTERFDSIPEYPYLKCAATNRDLKLRRGEQQIDAINSVEDTKGNNTGVRGSLIVTNLRLIWISHKDNKINLSIGHDCVTSIRIKNATSRLRGETQALFIMSKFERSRFEFIFTSLVKASPRMFITVQSVHRAYQTSTAYRDLKLRGALVKDKKLKLLPDEEIYQHIDGVWNLSLEQGNLGSMLVTNVRLVWFAKLAENFNVSMPYLQMKSVSLRASGKFGQALVVNTNPKGKGYLLGFKIEPAQVQEEAFKTIVRLHEVYSQDPNFGVRFKVEDKPEVLSNLTVPRAKEDLDVVDEDVVFGGSYQAYLSRDSKDPSEGKEEVDDTPRFCAELGLAMQPLPDGYTVERLWHGN